MLAGLTGEIRAAPPWDMDCAHLERLISPALRAARKAGPHVARAEIARDGKIVLMFNKDGEAPCTSECNEWDEINGED